MIDELGQVHAPSLRADPHMNGSAGHVYLYVHDFRSSGVVRNALTYARRIARDHPTTLVAAYDEGLLRDEARQGPFACAVLADRQERHPRLAAVPRLRRWLQRRPPGVLMSMGVHGHPTVFLATRGRCRQRRIYRISNEVGGAVKGDGRLRQLWLRLLIRDAARLILVGAAMTDYPIFRAAMAEGKALAIPNGVDRDAAARRAAAPAPHPWLTEHVPIVLAIGRLRPQKNLDLLVEAVGIAQKQRRLRLIILGEGSAEERTRMTRLAADYTADFLLAGETDNVFAWLARAQVFALPSLWETSALVLLEALAVGTPVVASRLAGDAARVLDEGRYGLLFDGADPQALAQALLRQLSADRVPPGDRADAYAIERTADRYAEVVQEVMAIG